MKIYNLMAATAVAAIVGSLAMVGTANASLSIISTVGGAPTGVTLDNLDSGLPTNGSGADANATGGTTATGIIISFSPDGGAVLGAKSGIYAPPFLSGGNGTGFGPGGTNQADGPDDTVYVTAGGITGSSATFLLPDQELYFGLLWGSVDPFNSLEFFDKDGNSIGIITGTDVGVATGDQGVLGTYYVNISSTTPFVRVVATSGDRHAFEIDNLAFNPTVPTGAPEPITLSLFGAGLAGLGLVRRRRKA
jgi:hypothetical protein